MEGEDPTRKLLEQKLTLLQGQIQTLYEYIGNPQGELFASAIQVNRLEQSVYKNQTTLEQLKLQSDTLSKGLTQYIDELFGEISKQRGARSADIQTLVKFTSTQLTEAVQRLQAQFEQTVQKLIPFKKLQDMERHFLSKDQKQSNPYSTFDTGKVAQLETRLGLLESKAAKEPEVQAQNTTTESSNTEEELLGRIKHLEEQFIQYASKAHATSSRSSTDLSTPLAALQSQVTILSAEVQAFRVECSKRLIDAQISAMVQAAKQSLEKQLAEKAATTEVETVKKAVDRAEGFSREVQTGFIKFKHDFETITLQIQDTLTAENLDDFRQLRATTETLGEDVKKELASVRLLSREFGKVNKTLSDLREENQTHVETWLQTQLATVQDSLKVYNDQKMNIIRYQLANEVEKIVKEDFEKFFNTKSIKLIESHVETKLPENIKKQVSDRVTELDLASKHDVYTLQKELSRVVDLNRSTEKTLSQHKQHVAEQIEALVNQIEIIGKTATTTQTEVGKLNKQVQSLQLQVKDLHMGIQQEQKRFEARIVDMIQDMRQSIYSDLVDQDRKPAYKPPVKATSTVPSSANKANGSKRQDVLYSSLTKCFYTALFASSPDQADTLGDFERIPGWDYICFTNLDLPMHRGWKIVNVDFQGGDPALAAKWHKWNSHKVLGDYDVVVWMDAYLSPNPMYSELLKHWILQMMEQNTLIIHRPHNERNCIWEECDAVVQTQRARLDDVRRVVQALEDANMPKEYGLYDTNVMIKLHKNMLTQYICEEVYQFMEEHCNRDQLAVTLVYYKNNFRQVQEQTLLRITNASGVHYRKAVVES